LEMVEIGDSNGDRGCEAAVEATGSSGLWLPCPRGREPSERAETWRRRGEREPSAAGASAAAGWEEASAAAGWEEASAAAGWEGPSAAAAEAARASAAAGEAAPVAGAAPPVGATTSLAAATLPLREPPPGIVEDEVVEGTGAARPLSAAVRRTADAVAAGSAGGRRSAGMRRTLQRASWAPAARWPALQNWATWPVVPHLEQRRRKASVWTSILLSVVPSSSTKETKAGKAKPGATAMEMWTMPLHALVKTLSLLRKTRVTRPN
jgi:hypothetical protein